MRLACEKLSLPVQINKHQIKRADLSEFSCEDGSDASVILHKNEGRLLLTDKNGLYHELIKTEIRKRGTAGLFQKEMFSWLWQTRTARCLPLSGLTRRKRLNSLSTTGSTIRTSSALWRTKGISLSPSCCPSSSDSYSSTVKTESFSGLTWSTFCTGKSFLRRALYKHQIPKAFKKFEIEQVKYAQDTQEERTTVYLDCFELLDKRTPGEKGLLESCMKEAGLRKQDLDRSTCTLI